MTPDPLDGGEIDLVRFGVALLIGALVGFERQFAGSPRRKQEPAAAPGPAPEGEAQTTDVHAAPPSGVRTFTLVALAGGLTGHLSHSTPWLLPAALLALGALVVAAYVAQAHRGRTGLTSEVACLAVFLLGAEAVHGNTGLAMAGAIAVAAVLSTREALHAMADRLEREDIHAVLKFASLSVVVLPLLPAQPIRLGDVVASIRADARAEAHASPGAPSATDAASEGSPAADEASGAPGATGATATSAEPTAWWEGLSIAPRSVWKMVIFISGISFAGYVLGKVIGVGRGLLVTAALGGLVSSTAVSLAYSQRSRESPELSPLLATGILLANAIMPLRLLLVVGVLAPTLAARLALPLLSIVLVAAVATAILHLRRGDGELSQAVSLNNPFELGPALKFGLLFGVVLLAAQVAVGLFGNAGLYVVAVLTGLTDVDAISLAVANLAANGRQELLAGATTIVLAVASNTVVKAGFVIGMGAPQLRRIAIVAFGLMLAGAAGGIVAVWLLSV